MKPKTARVLQYLITKGEWVYLLDMAYEMYENTIRAVGKAAGMYPDLAILERDGFVESCWEELPPGVERPRRRMYRAVGSKSVEASREIARATRKKRRLSVRLPWRRPSTA